MEASSQEVAAQVAEDMESSPPENYSEPQQKPACFQAKIVACSFVIERMAMAALGGKGGGLAGGPPKKQHAQC